MSTTGVALGIASQVRSILLCSADPKLNLYANFEVELYRPDLN